MMHRVCWGCWIGGAILIVLSRWGLVSLEVGWAGFYVASAASVLSYLTRRGQPARHENWGILTSAMLESKDHVYDAAIATLRNGGMVICDELAFTPRPGDEFELATVASLPAAEMDEGRAIQDAECAQAAFEAIARSSPEIAALASEKRLRISLRSEFGTNGVEICQVAVGQVDWKINR